MMHFSLLCRRSKSSSHSPRPSTAVRRTENNNPSSTAVSDNRSRHDKDRGADGRKMPRHASSSDVRKSSPSSSDVRRSKKAVRATSPSRQRSLSDSPELTSSKHKKSKLISLPVVVSKSHKHNGHRRHGHSRSKERRVHSGADRRRWPSGVNYVHSRQTSRHWRLRSSFNRTSVCNKCSGKHN